MSLKEEIDNLESQIRAIDDQSHKLQQQAWELHDRRSKLIANMILEEKLLKDSTWTLQVGSTGGAAYLAFNGSSQRGTPMARVQELARTNWHSGFDLQDGVSLLFDDNDISLHFKEGKMLLPFVQKHGLIVNGSGIQDRLTKLKRDIASLEAICHAYKL